MLGRVKEEVSETAGFPATRKHYGRDQRDFLLVLWTNLAVEWNLLVLLRIYFK